MKYDVDICHLSEAFYDAYPLSKYPELMRKYERPYTCLLIENHEDYLTCIPFRSSIQHKEAFLFNDTNRSLYSHSGLDCKKTALIKDLDYIDTQSVVIDSDEYTAMIKNIDRIVSDIDFYINRYKNHITGALPMHPRAFVRHYQYSTLPYFHDILGI